MKHTLGEKENARHLALKKTVGSRISRLALILALMASVGIMLGVRAYNPQAIQAISSAEAIAAPSTRLLPTMQSGQASAFGPFHVVQFALYDVGIYPREVLVSKGLIALSIEDLSGGTTGLVIERQNGNGSEQLGLVQRAANSLRGRGEIDLGPGAYAVYMADRPDNRALMIVEP